MGHPEARLECPGSGLVYTEARSERLIRCFARPKAGCGYAGVVREPGVPPLVQAERSDFYYGVSFADTGYYGIE